MPETAPARRRDVRLIYLLAVLVTTSQGALEFTLPLSLHAQRFPLPLIGGAVAGMGLGQILSRLPGGAWYRIERARRLVLVSLLLFAASTAALALTGSWLVVALLVTVHGFAMGLSTTFMLALLIDVRPPGSRVAITMSWYTAAISTGYAIGNPLAAQVIAAGGHGVAFLVSAVFGLAAAGVGPLLQLRPAGAEGGTGGPAATRPGGILASVVALPAPIWLATLAVFYINYISDLLGTFYPIYALGLGLPLAFVGLLKSINSVSATGIRFAAAGLFRLVAAGPVNQVAVAAMALAVLGLSWSTQRPWLVVLFTVLGLSRGLIRVTTATAVAEQRQLLAAGSGMASGVYNAGLDAGSMLAPPLGGVLASAVGIPNAFRASALVLVLLYYATWLWIRTRPVSPAAAQTVPATSAE